MALAGCYTGPNAEHYVAIVDGLDVPAGWELAKSEVRGPDQDDPCDPFFTITCPSASRTFLVDGDAAAAYAQAKDVVRAAGFAITQELLPDELLPDCTGAPSGSACVFFSSRDGDQISVYVYHSAADVGLGDQGLGGTAVIISAHRHV